MQVGEETYEVTKDMVDIRISSKEGFTVGMDNNKFVILNTTLTDELINEGLARETVSKIQQLRKNMNFDIADRINLYLDASEEYKESIFNPFVRVDKSINLVVTVPVATVDVANIAELFNAPPM